jgi:hypothetical protein
MLARQAEVGGCGIEDLEAWAAPLSSGAHRDTAVRRMVSRSAWAAVATCPVGSPAFRAGGRLLDAQFAANRALHGISRDEIAALVPQRRRQLVKDLVPQAGSGHVVAARLRDAGLLRVEDLDWWLDDLRGAGALEVSGTPAFFAVSALADAVNDEEASRVAAAADAAVTPEGHLKGHPPSSSDRCPFFHAQTHKRCTCGDMGHRIAIEHELDNTLGRRGM